MYQKNPLIAFENYFFPAKLRQTPLCIQIGTRTTALFDRVQAKNIPQSTYSSPDSYLIEQLKFYEQARL